MSKKSKSCFWLGGLQLIVAGCMVSSNIYFDIRARILSQRAVNDLIDTNNLLDSTAAITMQSAVMPNKIVNDQKYIGILEFPSQNLKLPIISECDDSKLKLAPCRYAGSIYQNNMIIAAHNYWSHFGTLKNLSLDDAVLFTDLNGCDFFYHVADIDTISPSTSLDDVRKNYDLTLFTCTWGGKYRVVVHCEKDKNIL